MKIVAPYFKVMTPTGLLTEGRGIELLKWIEFNARISHRSEEKQGEDSWKRFIQAVVLEHGDWSVTEHATVTALIYTNRGITHELVRHRISSFTQESTRFVNYTKGHEANYIPSCEVLLGDLDEWIADLAVADAAYMKWLKKGYSPQIARDHLPNALASMISVTCNLRNWRHFFLMRTTKEAHPDMRVWAIAMLRVFKDSIPLLYDDIEPNARQVVNLGKPR